jgi:hypothetical protein
MATISTGLQWPGPGTIPPEGPPVATSKNPASYRLSPEGLALIDRLAEALGLSKTSVIELAVRQLARRELGRRETAPRGKGKKAK